MSICLLSSFLGCIGFSIRVFVEVQGFVSRFPGFVMIVVSWGHWLCLKLASRCFVQTRKETFLGSETEVYRIFHLDLSGVFHVEGFLLPLPTSAVFHKLNDLPIKTTRGRGLPHQKPQQKQKGRRSGAKTPKSNWKSPKKKKHLKATKSTMNLATKPCS